MNELYQFEITVRVCGEFDFDTGQCHGDIWVETHIIEARNEDAAQEIFFDDYAKTDRYDYAVVSVIYKGIK